MTQILTVTLWDGGFVDVVPDTLEADGTSIDVQIENSTSSPVTSLRSDIPAEYWIGPMSKASFDSGSVYIEGYGYCYGEIEFDSALPSGTYNLTFDDGNMGVSVVSFTYVNNSGITVPVKVSNAWKDAAVSVKVGGAWKSVQKAWMKVEGVWRALDTGPQYPEVSTCMRFRSTSGSMTIGMLADNMGGSYPDELYYNINDTTWTKFTGSVTVPQNQYVYFWNKGTTLSTSSSNCYYFTTSGSNIAVSGNPLSLVNFASMSNFVFAYLFYACLGLTSASGLTLPSSLTNGCYFGMFYGCTDLVDAPSLTVATLLPQCYQNMFYNCSSLQVNEGGGGNAFVSFTTTAENAVQGMLTGTGGTYAIGPVAGRTYYYTSDYVWRELSATATGPVYGYTQTGTISGGTYLPTMWTLKLSSAPSIRRNATFDFDSASSTCQIRTSNTPVGSYCCSNSDNIKTSDGSRDSGMVSPSYVANITSISDNTIWGKLVSATVSATIYGVGVARYITGGSASASKGIVVSSNASAYPSYGVQNGKFYIRVDKNSPSVTWNKALDTSGALVDCAGWATTDYIEIPTNCTTVYADGNDTHANYSVICEYDSNKSLVDYWDGASNPRTITLTGAYTKYVRFSFKANNVGGTSSFAGLLKDNVNNVVLFG